MYIYIIYIYIYMIIKDLLKTISSPFVLPKFIFSL